jgi:polysaccharide export outer membrane protein
MKNIVKMVLLLMVVNFMFSCNSHKKIVYLKDIATDTIMSDIGSYSEIIIQPMDILSIVVSSKIPELALPFNLPLVTYQAGSDSYGTGQQRILGYSVDKDGEIDFPMLGKIKVAGLTRRELVELIKSSLVEADYINEPIVTVQFMNFRVHVIGEVTRPGTYDINGEHITLLEALGMAGDLTVFGKRENVKIIREKGGERTIYKVDLGSSDLFNSPAYYLQQNDIVYVEPNKYKARNSTNTNQFTQASLWVSVASLVATITMLIVRK